MIVVQSITRLTNEDKRTVLLSWYKIICAKYIQFKMLVCDNKCLYIGQENPIFLWVLMKNVQEKISEKY